MSNILTPKEIEDMFPRFWPNRPKDRCCLTADELLTFARAIEAATAAKYAERIAELQAKLDAAAVDAERWRQWARGEGLTFDIPAPTQEKPNRKITVMYAPNPEPDFGPAMSAAIDAMRQRPDIR